MTTDYFGNEIKEGDEVIFATGGSYDQRDFLQAPVTKINPKSLLIKIASTDPWGRPRINQYKPQPHQVVVVPKQK